MGNTMTHIQVNKEEAQKIIEHRSPLGTFWLKDGSLFVGIDNKTGNAWTEEFFSAKECFAFLNGEEVQ